MGCCEKDSLEEVSLVQPEKTGRNSESNDKNHHFFKILPLPPHSTLIILLFVKSHELHPETSCQISPSHITPDLTSNPCTGKKSTSISPRLLGQTRICHSPSFSSRGGSDLGVLFPHVLDQEPLAWTLGPCLSYCEKVLSQPTLLQGMTQRRVPNPSLIFACSIGTEFSHNPLNFPWPVSQKTCWPWDQKGRQKSKWFIFFCTTSWLQYKLGDDSQWPEFVTLDFQIANNLNTFYTKEQQTVRGLLGSGFFLLWGHPFNSCFSF